MTREEQINERYKGLKLLRVVFPEFWQKSYESKNNFFRYVYDNAKRSIDMLEKYPCIEIEKWLKENPSWQNDDSCKDFWHDHCWLCEEAETVYADMKGVFYCSEEEHGLFGHSWICFKCFDNFKERFGWTVVGEAEDIIYKDE